MNKYLYHVIFNERRGQSIVVAEKFSGGAHKEGGSVTVNFEPGARFVERRHAAPLLHPLAVVLRSAFGVAASIAVPAHAQIIADPNAPGKQRPTVLQTANGVVQVNIQTPSQAGVSRNTYTQFDVARNGAVLNNSRDQVQTQLGGWVQGNPWLLRNTARVILNEVNSSSPSQLKGYLEVAGQRAEVVIANPSGIDVDGAGFINASRVTLTTGVPRVQDGSLAGILVQQGRVSVTGRGLDAAQTDYAGILARAVDVNANIWAKELHIVTGANQIDATAAATPVAASGSRPSFAIDVAQLGGMYAGRITLIGTEQGVGVRNAGAIEATSGNLVLNANGWLTNSGSILASAPKAGADIEATGNITNSGKLYAAGDINVRSRGDVANTGLIAAQNNASVLAAGATSRIDAGSGAVFASGLTADGTVLGTGDLNLLATASVSHHGTALGATMRVSGSEVDLSHASLTGGQIKVLANVGNLDASGAAITATGLLVLDSAKSVDTGAATAVAQQLRVKARNWSNVGGEILQSGSGDTDITLSDAGGTLDNTSGRIAMNSANLTLGAGTLVNTGGKIEHAGTGTFAIRAQKVDDQHGTITGNGALDVSAGGFDHRDATTAASQVNIAAASLDNQGGRIIQVGAGAGAITVSGSLANSAGTIQSNGDASVNAGALDNSDGRITAIGSVSVGAGAGLNNAHGLVAAGDHLAVQGGSIDNSHGTLQAQGGNATLRVNDLNNASGGVFAAGRLDTVAASVANTGTLYAGGDQNLTVSGAVVNSGVIAAQGSTSVSAQSLSSVAGSLVGAGVKGDGALTHSGVLSITTRGVLAAHGQNLAGDSANLQGSAVDLSGSQTGASSMVLRATDGDVTTTGATVTTAGMLEISAAAAGHGLVNRQGMLSAGQLDVQVANLDNTKGTLIQSGSGDSSIVVNPANGVLDNTQGRIEVNGNNLGITAATLTNVDGTIGHAGAGTLTITATNFNDQRGSVASNGMLALAADVLNHEGATTSAGGMSVHAGTLSNRGGRLLQSGTGGIAVEVTRGLDNIGGQIAADGPLTLQSGAIENNQGRITSGASAQVISRGKLDNSTGVLAAGHSIEVAGVAVDNTGGMLQSGQALSLDAATLRNSKGVLSAGTDLAARLGGDLSNDGLLYAGRNQDLKVGGTLTNTGSIAAQGDTTVVAASVDSGGGALLGAGIGADGTLAQSGSLTVQAAGNLVAKGQNLAAGAVSLSGTSVDVRGSDTAGGNISLAASSGDVHTAGAKVNTAGTLNVTATHVLDNVQGNLSAGQLALKVAILDNRGGRIAAAGSATVGTNVLNNADGLIAARTHLTVQGGDVDNSRGVLQAQGGDASLRVGDLNNAGGSVYAAGKLDTVMDNLANSGTLYAGADQLLTARGTVTNSGTIAAQGSTTVVARSLSSEAGSLLGAGVKADGTLAPAGDLSVATTGTMAAHGQNLAAGQASLQGAAVDLSGSQTSATNVMLRASAGDVTTSGATVATAGTLAISATAEGHGLVNANGRLGGGHLELQMANLDNRHGTLLQSGSADSSIVLSSRDGVIDNTAGRMTSNGNNLSIGAATFTNVDGHIEHAGTGTLNIAATTFNDARGSVASNGTASMVAADMNHNGATTSARDLRVHAGALANRGGHLLQSGAGSMALEVGRGLDNAGGEIAGDGALHLQAGAIDNSHGHISSGASATVSSAGQLNNSDGVLTAAHSLTAATGAVDNTRGALQANDGALALAAASVRNNSGVLSAGTDVTARIAGDLANDAVIYAGRNQTLTVGGALTNTGSIAAQGDTTIVAASIDSRAGGLLGAGIRTDGSLAQDGALAVRATGNLVATGQNLAAGDVSLSGAGIDLHGGATSGTNIVVSASGNVDTSHANVGTAGTLAVVAHTLGNAYGTLSAGQLALQVANLDNNHGRLIQTGAGDTNITLSAPDGTLDNTAGHIAVNSGNLTLGAGVLVNNDARIEHAGSGKLVIRAGAVTGQRGQIIGNGVLDVIAGAIDHRGAYTSAQQIRIAATSLDNRAGQIASNGDATISASTLDNGTGRIVAVGSADVAGSLNNTDGLIAAGMHLLVHGGDVDNTRGTVQAQGGDAALNVGTLSNAGGNVYAAGRLDTTAASVANSGSLYAGGDQHLAVRGALDNTGLIAAQGNVTVSTASLASAAGSLLGAGVRADGALAATGDLSVTTTNTLASHGQNLAAGQLSLAGSKVDVSGSQTAGAGVALHAIGDDVVTSGAMVATSGTLAIHADGHGMVNRGGTLIGSQLDLQLANLDNRGGELVQSGTGDTRIVLSSPSGVLDNTQGRIAVNAANLSIAAGTLTNTSGEVMHAGSGVLDILASTLSSRDGKIIGNGSLHIAADDFDNRANGAAALQASITANQVSIAAGRLDNSHALIVQRGSGGADITVLSALINQGGTIASNGDMTIHAGTLDNQGGSLMTAAAGRFSAQVNGALDNRNGGNIATAGSANIRGESVLNEAGRIVAGDGLLISAATNIQNGRGVIAAIGPVQVTAGELTNDQGKLTSVGGNVQVATSGLTQNDSGVIQAGGEVVLTNSGMSNTQLTGAASGGSVVGRSIRIDTAGTTFNNQSGTVAATQDLSILSGAVSNAGGLIQSGGGLRLDTAGQALDNSNASAYGLSHSGSAGGVVSGGNANLNVGEWNNAAGFFGAGGSATVQAGNISNTVGGQVIAAGSLDISAIGLNNQAGQVQALGDIRLALGAGILDNRHALIRSGGTLNVAVNAIDNRDTQGVGQGLEGQHLVLSALAINNSHGAIRADGDAQLRSSGSLTNTQGLISAGRSLAVTDDAAGTRLEIDNTGGTLIAGTAANVRAATLTGGGRLVSFGDLSLELNQDYVNGQGGDVQAARDARFVMHGDFSNSGKLSVGGTLSVEARNVDNTANGEISATTTRVTATGGLHNRGLIDGNDTEINAGVLDNAGTGRIYGGHLSIAAGVLNNDVENGVAGTIAARGRLDIGVRDALTNREHALILSGGDMAIGGALDANRTAAGQAGSVTNASATIEAMGNLSLIAGTVSNLNNHFTVETKVESIAAVTEYQGNRSKGIYYPSPRYAAGTPGVRTYMDESLHLQTPAGDAFWGGDFDDFTQYNFTRTTQRTFIATSEPGRIASGGNLLISANNVHNDNSRILAGGTLSIFGARTNDATKGQKITSEIGTATNYKRHFLSGTDSTDTSVTSYAPPDVIETISVTDSLIKEYAFAGGAGAVPAMAAAGGSPTGATSAAGVAQAAVKTGAVVTVATTIDPNAAATGDAAGAVSSASPASGAATDGAATQTVAIGTVSGSAVAAAQGVGTGVAGPVEFRTGSVGVEDHEVHKAVGQGGQSQSTRADFGPVDAGTGPVRGLVTVTAQQAAAMAGLSAPATAETGHSATATVAAAGTASSAAQAQAPEVAKATLSVSSGGVHSVRTTPPSIKLPGTSLFQIQSSPSASYLVETDPRFTNHRQWLGSDYMLDQLALDPQMTQKRLGDGYYEQSLVREQVTQLASQRFLAGYTSDDDEYRGLMDAGISFAKQWKLRPGVSLSADQMAALTKDMVWLVAQEVTLADGSVQKVLVPQVYLASEGTGAAGAALLSGQDVLVKSTGNFDNTGKIVARNTLQLAADNVNNLGGRIQGNSVRIDARTDINVIGGTISAAEELIALAGRDIKLETTTRSATSTAAGNQFGRTTIDQVASLQVTGDGTSLIANAGRDLSIVGGRVDNAGAQGRTVLVAGRDLNLGTVTTARSEALAWDTSNFHKESASTEVGSQVHGAGTVVLKAGSDLNLRAANVEAGSSLAAIAGNNVNLLAGTATDSLDDGRVQKNNGFLHTETITLRDTVNHTSAVGSVLSGQTVDVQAGHDLVVLGSAIVGENNVNLTAGNMVSVNAATNQSTENHYRSVKESGFLSGGGFGISYGTRTTTTDQSRDAATQSGQARSMVGSIAGNLNVSAGEAIKIAGSDLSAGKDINLVGKSVSITPGVDNANGKFTSKMTQDAFTLAVGGSVVNAIQNAQGMGAAAGQTSNGRLKALAAASAVMTAKDAAKDLAANGPSAKISLTVGHSESESTEVTASRTHAGGVLAAGNNVSIVATRAGKASNIDIVGSEVRATHNVSLAADNQVNLLAAQDGESQHSQSKSWSAAVGVAAELSKKPEFGVTASASANRGNIDGEATTQVNTHVTAGERLTIASGGDTNLKGAVASANQVVTAIKGNLNIESLQDTATLDGQRQSASISGTLGAGAGFSASVSQSKVHNDYASVGEQSGIRAGDGGFQLQVAGNTDLKGGVISSSEQAIKDGRNSLATAALSFSDIQNRDSTAASGVSLGVNVGDNQKGDTFSPSMAPGVGKVSASQGSVTHSGVSGAALTVSDQQPGQAVANLNRDVSTGNDASGALTKGWTGAKALDEVNAQMQITTAAMPRLAKEIGDYASIKTAELNKEGKPEEAAKWAEGGIYRVAAHAALGAMGGGLGGAAGATASALAAPTLTKLEDAVRDKLADAGLNSEAAKLASKLIAGGAAAAIGGAAGGSAGAVTGLNGEANNRQLHSTETNWIKKNAEKFAKEGGISVEDATRRLAQQASKDVDLVWRGVLPDNEDKEAKAFLAGAQGESFTNSFGQKQALFTTQDGQFTAAQSGLFEGDKEFVNKYLTPYANRTALTGVRTEIWQTANAVAETVKRDPFGVAKQAGISLLTGALETISHPVNAANGLIDSTVSGAKTFGEGVAASTNGDIQRQLNSLYGQDVTSAVQLATSAQGAMMLGSALGAGKAGSKAVTAVGDAAKFTKIKIELLSERAAYNRQEFNQVKIDSNISRDADMTTGLRRAEDVNKLFSEIGYDAPFTNGTYVNVSMSKPGASAYLVVSDLTGQAKAIDAGKPALGAFATPDFVPSQAYARETLAITSNMKVDVSRVVQVETTGKSMVQIEGKVAPQEPIGLYPGNGNQVFYDYPRGSVRTEYVKPVGTTQALPVQNPATPKTTIAMPAVVLPSAVILP